MLVYNKFEKVVHKGKYYLVYGSLIRDGERKYVLCSLDKKRIYNGLISCKKVRKAEELKPSNSSFQHLTGWLQRV